MGNRPERKRAALVLDGLCIDIAERRRRRRVTGGVGLLGHDRSVSFGLGDEWIADFCGQSRISCEA